MCRRLSVDKKLFRTSDLESLTDHDSQDPEDEETAI
jgi:hypothetical protein